MDAKTLKNIATRLKDLGHNQTYGSIAAQIDITERLCCEIADVLKIEWNEGHSDVLRKVLALTGNISQLAQALENGGHMPPRRKKKGSKQSAIADLIS